MPSGAEWIVVAAIGLLLFGKRLPEVGKSLAQGIVQFKKGLKNTEEDIEKASEANPATPAAQPMLTQQTTPPAGALPHSTTVTAQPAAPAMKFDPYTGKPVENSTTSQT
jgi:sec-independent protein translocase protein TatA